MMFIRQGATHKVVLGPAVAVGDGFTPVTTLALSSADEAEAILHDNGTVVDLSGYTWAAITTADGYYHLTLQSGISNTVGHLTIVVNDDSLCLPLRQDFTVLEEAVYDAMFAGSALGYVANAPVNVAQVSGDSTAADTLELFAEALDQATGQIDSGTFANGAITAAAIATNAIDDDALAADAVTAIQNGLATPTNITAGTITTVTNLTNAPTNGDLTATMKTSVTTAATAATPAAASVTAPVTVGTNNDKTGYSLTATTGLGNQTANITGNLSGSVGSVTGAVGSVTGAVGSVTGNVGGIAGTINTLDQLDTAQDTQHGTTQTYLTNNLGAAGAAATEAGGTGDHLTALATAAALQTVDNEVGAIDTVVDAIKVITDALGATAAARLALSAGTMVPGTIDTTAFSSTTTEFEADDITEATADHFNGRIVIFTSGVLLYQATDITDYAIASGRAHFTVTAMTEPAGNNDTFIIV
jgi:hypothetical protein